MSVLSADLIPMFSDPSTSVILGSIEKVLKSGNEQFDTGELYINVIESFNSQAPVNAEQLRVPYQRMAQIQDRVRNAQNHWNVLRLQPGDLLILACRPGESAGIWTCLAARQPTSASDSAIQAVRAIYQVEHLPQGDQKTSLLRKGLDSSSDLIFFYSIDAITRRQVVARPVAAQMLYKILSRDAIDGEIEEQLVEALVSEYIFDEDLGAEATNTLVLEVLANKFVGASDSEVRSLWLDELAATLFSEYDDDETVDSAIRKQLIQSISTPDIATVIEALAAYKAEATDPEDIELVQDVLDLWKAALQE